MMYTVYVEIVISDEHPPEKKWLANCTLEKGKLMRHIGNHVIEGNRVVRHETTEPVENDRTTIINHIEQEGWYY